MLQSSALHYSPADSLLALVNVGTVNSSKASPLLKPFSSPNLQHLLRLQTQGLMSFPFPSISEAALKHSSPCRRYTLQTQPGSQSREKYLIISICPRSHVFQNENIRRHRLTFSFSSNFHHSTKLCRSSWLPVCKSSISRQHFRGHLRALARRDVYITDVATFVPSKKFLILHIHNHIKVLFY